MAEAVGSIGPEEDDSASRGRHFVQDSRDVAQAPGWQWEYPCGEAWGPDSEGRHTVAIVEAAHIARGDGRLAHRREGGWQAIRERPAPFVVFELRAPNDDCVTLATVSFSIPSLECRARLMSRVQPSQMALVTGRRWL
jgi:hypothetical protein